MQLTFHGHACVRVSLPDAAGTLVIDPGTLSDTATALTGATDVLITHDHPDHVDVNAVVAALHTGTTRQVWATAPAADALRAGGAPAQQINDVLPGQVHDIAGTQVTVGGGEHALIHPEVPRAVNVTYLVTGAGHSLYHPGDSYDRPAHLPDAGLDVLLVPVSGPWMKIADAIDFARSVPAGTVVPIHDALLSDVGHALAGRWLDTARLGGDYTYRRLAPQESLTL